MRYRWRVNPQSHPPQDVAPGERLSRDFPATSTHVHVPLLTPLARCCRAAPPATTAPHSIAPCAVLCLVLRPGLGNTQQAAQGAGQKTRKRVSIFHIKKYFLFVPNLFPKCSQFVPKTICSGRRPIYKGFKAFRLLKNAVFPCSQEKQSPTPLCCACHAMHTPACGHKKAASKGGGWWRWVAGVGLPGALA